MAPDVVESVKASGPSYNTRVEQALRQAGFGAMCDADLDEKDVDAKALKKAQAPKMAKAALTKKRRAPAQAAKSAVSKRRA